MTISSRSLVSAATGAPPPEYVRRLAAVGFGVTVADLEGPSKQRPLVQYRQVTMTAVRLMCGLSYPAIGRQFGRRDHTTVMHAVRKVEGGRHHAAGTPRRRLWTSMDLLCQEVRRQWAIDTGQPVPGVGQMTMEPREAPPRTVVFS